MLPAFPSRAPPGVLVASGPSGKLSAVQAGSGRQRPPPAPSRGSLEGFASQGKRTRSQCCQGYGQQAWGIWKYRNMAYGNSTPPLLLHCVACVQLCGGHWGSASPQTPEALLAEPPALGPSLGWGQCAEKGGAEIPQGAPSLSSQSEGGNSPLLSDCDPPRPWGAPTLMETMWPCPWRTPRLQGSCSFCSRGPPMKGRVVEPCLVKAGHRSPLPAPPLGTLCPPLGTLCLLDPLVSGPPPPWAAELSHQRLAQKKQFHWPSHSLALLGVSSEGSLACLPMEGPPHPHQLLYLGEKPLGDLSQDGAGAGVRAGVTPRQKKESPYCHSLLSKPL